MIRKITSETLDVWLNITSKKLWDITRPWNHPLHHLSCPLFTQFSQQQITHLWICGRTCGMRNSFLKVKSLRPSTFSKCLSRWWKNIVSELRDSSLTTYLCDTCVSELIYYLYVSFFLVLVLLIYLPHSLRFLGWGCFLPQEETAYQLH